jgi:hypothetical protein
MNAKKIVVLGGCGQVGSHLVNLLLMDTKLDIVIADHNEASAKIILNDSIKKGFKGRLSYIYADTNDKYSLVKAFKNASFVITTVSPSAFNENIITACLECKCNYFDTLEPQRIIDVIDKFNNRIKKAKRLFITQGGLAPGMPLVFINYIYKKIGYIDKLCLYNALSLKTNRRHEQVFDVFDFTINNKPLKFINGKWVKCSIIKDSIKYSTKRFGKISMMPISMFELYKAPELFKIKEIAFYAGAPHVSLPVNMLFTIIVKSLNKIKPTLGWTTLAKYMLNNAIKNENDPGGYSLVIEAWKNKNKKEYDCKLILEHEDNYYSTAVIILSFLRQYLSGDFKNIYGLKLMGEIINPDKAIKFMKKFGLNLIIEL